MASIELEREHSLGADDVRTAVERVAKKLESDLDVDYRWDDDTLRFEGSGADGHIHVRDDVVHVVINLSFLLRPMRGWIRSEATRYLDDHLG